MYNYNSAARTRAIARRAKTAFLTGVGAPLAAWALSAGPSAADTPVDPFALAPEQLFDATVVSVSRTPESVQKAPAAVFVISARDIARSGVTSVPEALRLAPGVDVARAGGGAWAISIRGFNGLLANKLLVLVDGREVYDPLFSGVYWDAVNLPIGDIERIEVVRGPGATLWGANAVDGVISIITKKTSDTEGLLLTAAGGDHEADLSARYGGALGANAHWRLFGNSSRTGAFPSLSGANAHDASSAWRAGGRIDAQLSATDTLTFEAETYATRSGDLRIAPQLTAPYSVLRAEDLDAKGGDILARWSHERPNGSSFSLQAFASTDKRDRLTLDDRRTTFDLDTQYALAAHGPHQIVIGAGFRQTVDEPNTTAIIMPDRATLREDRLSGFVQDRIALDRDHWSATLGAKVENTTFAGLQLAPSARLQWTDASQTGWASVSRAQRTPSELEREYTVLLAVAPPGMLPVPISLDLVPSKGLDSEQLTAYELGYRRQVSATIAVDLTAFYNHYDHLATNVLLTPSLVLTPVIHARLPIGIANDTEAQSYGFEGYVDWRSLDTLDLSASYSFLDLNLSGPPSSVAIDAEGAERQSPRHQARLEAHWDYAANTTLDGSLAYVDGLPAYGVRDYTRFDLRWAHRLTPALEFEVVGQNLLDDSHREFGAASDVASTSVDRTFFGRLTWRD